MKTYLLVELCGALSCETRFARMGKECYENPAQYGRANPKSEAAPKYRVKSSQKGGKDTVALAAHPDFGKFRRRADILGSESRLGLTFGEIQSGPKLRAYLCRLHHLLALRSLL